MVNYPGPGAESDMRRRAAWLLVMLAVASGLFVVMLLFLTGKGNSTDPGSTPGPLDTVTNSAAKSSANHSSGSPAARTSTAAAAAGQTHCPTATPCILAGDPGNAVAAINSYRTSHGLSAVPGTVSPLAQNCALHNGDGCTGGWAETEVPTPDGAAAVAKIISLGRLADPQMKGVGVGWAYDPGAKAYYFAIVRS